MTDEFAPHLLPAEDPFQLPFTGSFGRYHLDDSIEVNYILSSLRLEDLEKLQTAADAFNFDEVEFEEMMQRDIDYERVQKQIVDEYLRAPKGEVIFFPPIIVSVVAVDAAGRPARDPLPREEGVREKEGAPKMGYLRWKTKFEVEFPLVDQATGYSLTINNKSENFVNYATRIRINTNEVKLVVIDGQHRFVALQQLLKTDRSAIKALELPVCFVFSPDAAEGYAHHDAVQAFRNMFVTINNEAKRVSGHFITLLKDRSLSSLAIRSLAQAWKDETSDATQSYLQMLEWNERQDALANQRRRSYSITTVGILNMALTKLFEKPYHTRMVASLADVRPQLEEGSDTAFSKICEGSFDHVQYEVLREQIERTIVKALDVLFKQPEPYRSQWERFGEARAFLEEKVRNGNRGYGAFKADVLSRFRLTNELDDQSVRVAEEAFESQIVIPEAQEVFFKNVFQQGLIRIWSDLHSITRQYDAIPHEKTAEAVCEALGAFCFHEPSLFDRERVYVRFTLYHDGGRPQTSDLAKNSWKSYIGATLLNERSFSLLRSWAGRELPEHADEFVRDLEVELEGYVSGYNADLMKRTDQFVRKNWEYGPFDPDKRDELVELRREMDSRAEASEEFEEALGALKRGFFLEARRKWGAAFGVDVNVVEIKDEDEDA